MKSISAICGMRVYSDKTSKTKHKDMTLLQGQGQGALIVVSKTEIFQIFPLISQVIEHGDLSYSWYNRAK